MTSDGRWNVMEGRVMVRVWENKRREGTREISG